MISHPLSLFAFAALMTPLLALDGSYDILTSDETGLEVGMNLYLPPGYGNPLNAGKRYPLMVFLGGAGERGDPTDAQVVYDKSTVWGPAKEVREHDRDFPYIIVTPISLEWYSSLPAQYDAMVEHLKSTTRVDPDRVYFTGACAGASGVMEFAQVHPRQLAAIVPCITETPTVRNPERVQEIPTWFFHGFADHDVNRSQTITWADAIAHSFGEDGSCVDNYPYGTAPDGSRTYNPDNQTGSFRPGRGWSWTPYTRTVEDSLLLFTMMSTDLHNVWHYAVTSDTVLHWLGRQRRQTSFAGTPPTLPGRIEAEAYDWGGYRRAYLDATVANTGLSHFHDSINPYDGGTDGELVDLAAGGDGTVLTGTEAGEWVEYTVNASSGSYLLRLRVSAAADGGRLRLLATDGSVVAGPIDVPATTGFTTIETPVILPPGVQTLRLAIDQGGFDLDWLEVAYPPGPVDIIVDNFQTDKVITAGPWVTTAVAPGYFAKDYLSAAPGTTADAVFRPYLPRGGDYRIYVQHPSQPSYGTVQVTIDPGTGGGTSTIFLDEHTGGGTWKILGVFTLPAGSSATVSIAVAGASGYVAADAVRFWEIDPDNHPPTVDLENPIDGSSAMAGTAVPLAAIASDPDTHSSTPGLQKVEFYADDGSGSTLVGVDSSGSGDPATFNATFTPRTPGTWSLTAVAYDFIGGVASSPVRTLNAVAPEAGSLVFSAPSYSVVEGIGSTTLTVQRVGGSAGAVSVAYQTQSGSATADDFTPASGSLSWPDGDTGDRLIPIDIRADDLVEGDETLTVALSGATGSATAGGSATVTIRDDDVTADGALQFSAATYPVAEADAGTSTVTVTVTRSAGAVGTASVTWTTSDGSASSGSDYIAGTGTLTFAAGETAKTFTVTILGDASPEPDETVALSLSASAGGAVLGTRSTAAVVIVSDDGHGAGGQRPTVKSHSCGSGSGLALLALVGLAWAGLAAWGARP